MTSLRCILKKENLRASKLTTQKEWKQKVLRGWMDTNDSLYADELVRK